MAASDSRRQEAIDASVEYLLSRNGVASFEGTQIERDANDIVTASLSFSGLKVLFTVVFPEDFPDAPAQIFSDGYAISYAPKWAMTSDYPGTLNHNLINAFLGVKSLHEDSDKDKIQQEAVIVKRDFGLTKSATKRAEAKFHDAEITRALDINNGNAKAAAVFLLSMR